MKRNVLKRNGLWTMLVCAGMLLLFCPSEILHAVAESQQTTDQFVLPEFQVDPVQYDLSIESPGFNPGAFHYSRSVALLVFSERASGLDFKHRVSNLGAPGITLPVLVPIFIRGHALLI